jgi:surface protein
MKFSVINILLYICVKFLALTIADAQTAITDANFQTACSAWVSNPGAATTTYGDIAGWNTGEVTDMSQAFQNAYSFNDDISAWDTSLVTDMQGVSNVRMSA